MSHKITIKDNLYNSLLEKLSKQTERQLGFCTYKGKTGIIVPTEQGWYLPPQTRGDLLDFLIKATI